MGTTRLAVTLLDRAHPPGQVFLCATVDTDMRFKQWFEDGTGSADQYGNDVSPEDNGLVRPQYLTKQPPDSVMANKLFGRKFMKKSLRRSDKVSNDKCIRNNKGVVPTGNNFLR